MTELEDTDITPRDLAFEERLNEAMRNLSLTRFPEQPQSEDSRAALGIFLGVAFAIKEGITGTPYMQQECEFFWELLRAEDLGITVWPTNTFEPFCEIAPGLIESSEGSLTAILVPATNAIEPDQSRTLQTVEAVNKIFRGLVADKRMMMKVTGIQKPQKFNVAKLEGFG